MTHTDELSKSLREHCAALEEENMVLRARLDRPTGAVEHYYSVAHVALLLDFSERWVREVFSSAIVPCGSDDRIAASAVNAYIATRRGVRRICAELQVLSARNPSELRRKAQASVAA
jgi:hypothetical protein